ncbi:MAG: glycosyltransferase, partial [Deltaproteobacteria bacterium]|nr:glycosyltransferase [Deltaproteobacteria bacterium]
MKNGLTVDRGENMKNRVSVIIPSLNEEENIGEALASVIAGDPFEVVVVDGGSTDRTIEIARSYDGVTVTGAWRRGRAAQMNEGARMCSGDTLLFLHADSTLPGGWSLLLGEKMRDDETIGGCFFVRLSGSRFIYRLIGWLINARTLLFRSFTGDQAMFMRREFFERTGGFPDVPLMEDLMMADRMRRGGRVEFIGKPVKTASRKWERFGPVRTIFLMWYIKSLFRAGRPPKDLAPY